MHQLTKRENEILGRIALGNQNKIIAAAFGLSEHTVKIHIHNIITKLGVHNRTEAVAIYFEHQETYGGEALPHGSGRSGSVPGDDA
jgi:DNA-binding NarL/FixJ family response regulator